LRAVLQAAHGNMTTSGVPNCLNYCVISKYIYNYKCGCRPHIRNVALGHIIQPGGPQVGDLCLIFAGKAFVHGIKFKLSIDSPPDFRVVMLTLFVYKVK
jgi:hypothetical protein